MRSAAGCCRLGMSCRCFFFFSSRRRHTRFDCDWSSDVCSSDLGQDPNQQQWRATVWPAAAPTAQMLVADVAATPLRPLSLAEPPGFGLGTCVQGDRESGGEGKRVDLGGRRIIKKKKNTKHKGDV